MDRAAALLATLRSVVGDANVRTDPAVVEAHVVDWTGRFRGATPAVVAPANVDEVAAVLRVCDEQRVAVVAQGGNTGLVGGSVPLHDELVVDLRRLDTIEPVDSRSGQVTAQAGVTLARLQEHARSAGWQYGVDLGARDVATVGGMIATNAGGVHVLRYGPTRRQVIGIEAVLADGRIVRRLDGLEKDNTGYDFAGLFCGSEGTLGIVTAALLRLVPQLAHTVVALLAFDDMEEALDAVGALRRDLDCVNAIELFFQSGLELVCTQLQLSRPFAVAHEAYVLVEAAAQSDPTTTIAAAVDRLAGTADVAVATEVNMARSLWRYREAHTEAINLIGPPHKLDVSLPFDHLAEFVRDVEARVHTVAPAARVWLFGHAGDGNVHVNVTGVAPDDEGITAAVLGFVAELHGSISAEHGIGSAKRAYVELVRTRDEIDVMRDIKRAVDPNGVMNPHVLLPNEPGPPPNVAGTPF